LIHNRGLDPESEPVAAKSLVALSEAIGETEIQKEVVQ
jgi:hypothetical protein